MKVRTTLFVCLLLISSAAFGQSVSFERRTYANLGGAQADLNNDGREDFIRGAPTTGARMFQVVLSTGDGVWGAPQNTTVPDADPQFFAIADFNGDGKADVIVANGTNHFYEYFGNGDGTFRAPVVYAFPSGQRILQPVVGNFNQDRRPDLLFAYTTDPNGFAVDMRVYFGNGDGGFTPGPITTNIQWGSAFAVADFDGDGKADVYGEAYDGFSGSHDLVLFGDGAGHFPVRVQPDHDGQFAEPRDVNGDGKMDLLAVPFVFSTHGSLYYPTAIALYGSSVRTFARQDLNFSRCLQQFPPQTPDLNGDGIPDLLFVERSNCDEDLGPATLYVVAATGRGDGSFNPEQTLQTLQQTDGDLILQTILRADRDTKPDALVSRTVSSGSQEFDVLLNTTSGNFPSCPAANSFVGINVCGPTPGGTATSPVHFGIGASGQTPMRKVEVWVDGVKKTESLRRHFSNYGFLDADMALANGTHNVSIYAAGWDNLLQNKTFTFTVGSGGGGGTCPTPGTATAIVICAPANGGNVNSPVHVSAAGGSAVTFMEVWVDGAKRFQNSGSKVETDLTLGTGSHTMTVFGRNSSGVVGKQTITFSVGGGGGGTCTPASATATVICSPTNGSNVSNPVSVQARGGSSVNLMEVWVDGTKRFQTTGNTVSTSLTLAAGTHKLTVFSKNGSTVLSNAVSTFAVL